MNYIIDTGVENNIPYLRVRSKLNGYCLLDFYGGDYEHLIQQSIVRSDECRSSNEQVINALIKRLFRHASCRESGCKVYHLDHCCNCNRNHSNHNQNYSAMADSVRELLNITYKH